MDTVSSIEEANGHSSTKSNPSTKLSRKCRALLLVSGVLAVLVVVATIVTIVVTVGTLDRHGDESDSKGQRGDHLIDIETRQLKQV